MVRLAAGFAIHKVVAIVCIFGTCVFSLFSVPSCGQRTITSTGTPAAPLSHQVGDKAVVRSEYSYRKAWWDKYQLFTNIRESCDLCNDNPAIYDFNKHLGLPKKAQYCSSSGVYTAHLTGMKFKNVNGMAYSWKQYSKLVFYPAMLRGNKRRKPDIKLMDAVVMTFSHVEYVSWDIQGAVFYDEKGIWTSGCNTKGGQNRKQGCYSYIFRPWSLVAGIYNHVGPWYEENVFKK